MHVTVKVLNGYISNIENEKNLKWNSKMKDWLKETVGYWNNIQEGAPEDPMLVAGLEV